MTTVIERTGPRSFRVFGSVDASNASGLADVMEELLGEPGDITLEMRDLEFLDSVGMGVLVTASSRLGKRGNLILESPVHVVIRAIELAGLLKLDNVKVTEATEPPESIMAIEDPPT